MGHCIQGEQFLLSVCGYVVCEKLQSACKLVCSAFHCISNGL